MPTEPILLDSTGKAILAELTNIRNALESANKPREIYGVTGINNGKTLTRTDNAVGKSSSDFDHIAPWCDMHEVTDSLGNKFIYIPKFYAKKTLNAWQVSMTKHDGFTTLFVDGNGKELDYVLVGKYKGSVSDSKLRSVSGVSPAVNATMATFRSQAQANGTGYQIEDYLIWNIIQMLFVIEYATVDAQSIVQGYSASGNTGSHTTGGTNNVTSITGSEDPTSGSYQMKYRGIEDVYGNVWSFCDGVSFSGADVYMSIDPTDYGSGKTTGSYSKVGTRATSSGTPQTITPTSKYPLLGYVTANGTDNFGDYNWYDAGGQILLVGGDWNNGSGDGLFALYGDGGASYSNSFIGSRLCYKPLS